MTSEFQAGKMILSQISMFNEAVVMFETVIEPAAMGAIDECVQAFAKEEKWDGGFKLKGENEDCWLAPKQWDIAEKDDEPQSKAWFAIDYIQRQGDYQAALFCEQGSAGGKAGFLFKVNPGVYGTEAACSKYLRSLNGDKIEQLRKFDLELVEYKKGKSTFFLPIVLNAESLAETWGNSGEFSAENPCFEPVKVALEKLKMAWPIFDGILKAWPVKA
jgi:hypothetical protein